MKWNSTHLLRALMVLLIISVPGMVTGSARAKLPNLPSARATA